MNLRKKLVKLISVQDQLLQQLGICEQGIEEDKHDPIASDQLLVSANDGICVIDREFRVLWINDVLCSQLNINKNRALNKKCYSIFDEAICKSRPCPITLIFNGETYNQYDIELKSNGLNIPYTLTAVTLKGIEEEPIVIVNFKKAKKKLVKNRLTNMDEFIPFGRLVGLMAEDFNNILNDVMENLSLIVPLVEPESYLDKLLKETQNFLQEAKEANEELMMFQPHPANRE